MVVFCPFPSLFLVSFYVFFLLLCFVYLFISFHFLFHSQLSLYLYIWGKWGGGGGGGPTKGKVIKENLTSPENRLELYVNIQDK